MTTNPLDAPPHKKAESTAKWARTMTKVRLKLQKRTGARWNIVEFGGAKGHESAGIVDLMAIRKDHRSNQPNGLKRGDLFEIILIQVKGGSARDPSDEDVARLKMVQRYYKAKAVVLAEWKKGKKVNIWELQGDYWVEDEGLTVFIR